MPGRGKELSANYANGREWKLKPLGDIVVTTSVGICDGCIRFRVKIESTRTGQLITLIALIAQMEEYEEEIGMEGGRETRGIE